MDRKMKETDAIAPGRLHTILATEEELVPSSGFVDAVMEKVQEEARVPAPIPFPWKRALPGLVLIAGVFGWGGLELFPLALSAMKASSPVILHLPAEVLQPIEGMGWVALALVFSLASWLLARRLAGRSGLL
jgi:hypothetical protein